jgi:SNF2 family DNA or RNA helicase
MHEILRPFVLRRLKREVLGDKLPPKVHHGL